jgi:hypothetical protein
MTTVRAASEVVTYELSYDVGFLNAPKPYDLPPGVKAWQPFEHLVQMVIDATPGKLFRVAVDELETAEGTAVADAAVAQVESLDRNDVRWLYSTFMILCQKYVHGDPTELRDVIPECIGRPWIALSEIRGSPLTLTYDGLIINNWRYKDANQPASIDNIDVALVVSGTEPEKNFALVHMGMEAAGKDWPPRMLTLHADLLKSQTPREHLLAFLNDSLPRLMTLTQLLGKMWKMCTHEDYWNVVRVTLMGSPEASFPNGVTIRNTNVMLDRRGGSGAQSPLMHAVDTYFGIEHHDVDNDLRFTYSESVAHETDGASLTDEKASELKRLTTLPAHAKSFFEAQKHFMCSAHRDYFFKKLELQPTARDLVTRYGDSQCVKVFNECISLIEKMRRVHQQIAHKYVAEKAIEARLRKEVGTGGGLHVAGEAGGTAGSNFVSMLAQSIAETRHTRLGEDQQ